MYIEQLPSGRHRAEIRIPGTRRKVRKTFDYAYEAETWAVAEEARLRALADATTAPALDSAPAPVVALAPTAPVVTFAQHGADWIARQGHLERGTRDDYARCIRIISDSELGTMVMASVQRREYQQWLTQQIDSGTGRPTINRRTKVLRMVWRDAIAHGVATADPSFGIRLLTTAQTDDRTLTRDEEATLLAATTDDTTRVLCLLGLDAGLRWQEAAGLNVGALFTDDQGRPWLRITQVVEAKSRRVRPYVKGARLGHRIRKVPVTARLLAELAPLCAGASDGGALLFTSDDGRPLDYRNWQRRTWKPLMRRAGLRKPAPTFHKLRHTFGSRLAAAGVARSKIARWMGHADEETTARYIHADDSSDGELMLAALASPAERKRMRKAARKGAHRHLAAVS